MRSSGQIYLRILAVCLAGYVLAGRGFAYIGVPPIFIGELCMIAGVAVLIFGGQVKGLLNRWTTWLIVIFMVWGAVRTLPFVRTYRVDALRDAVMWGYALFALIVVSLLQADPARLPMLVRMYRTCVIGFVLLAPVLSLLMEWFEQSLPQWPWASVSVIHIKGGDIAVHVAGAAAFLAIMRRRFIWLLVPVLTLAVIINTGRAAMLTVLGSLVLIVLFRPRGKLLPAMAVCVAVPVVFLAITGARVRLSDEREVSFKQITATVQSIYGESESKRLSGSKDWRLQWWREIIDYTFNGRYFWQGVGYGVNLADDDKMQCTEDKSLRSPHNGHMTILARSGVPGLVIWSTVHLCWLGAMLKHHHEAKRRRQQRWMDLFAWLFIYYVAFLTNATFDVFLEGPMGGIWLWTLHGVGLGAIWIHRRQPNVLEWQDESAVGAQLLPAAGWGGPGLPGRSPAA